jgi:hypothetical protein
LNDGFSPSAMAEAGSRSRTAQANDCLVNMPGTRGMWKIRRIFTSYILLERRTIRTSRFAVGTTTTEAMYRVRFH